MKDFLAVAQLNFARNFKRLFFATLVALMGFDKHAPGVLVSRAERPVS